MGWVISYEIGTVTGSALNNAASGHKMLFRALRTFLETVLPVGERWVPQRIVEDSAGETISSIMANGNIAAVTTVTPNKRVIGDTITIAGASDSLYNGVFLITAVSDFIFYYTMLAHPSAAASGSLSYTINSYEVIWKAPGLSGTEEIFAGIKTYQSASADYYNFKVAGFTGFVPLNPFETQAGHSAIMGCTLWNQDIDYWFIGNGQRVIVIVKVLDVYESFYLGKYLPYATPSQYPYPLAVWASMATAALTRYSDTTLVSGFKGSRANFQIRAVDGNWIQPDCYPFKSSKQLRNTVSLSTTAIGYYGLHSIILSLDTPDVYGELDGVYYISGFNNATENTLTLAGIPYIVFRDRRAVGFNDYIAVKLQ